jgi:hypothetical protein
VWSIRAKLQLERGIRDLALFNLAIDSNLRACDLYPRAIAVLRVAPAQIGAQGPIACRHAWLADGSKAPCSAA